jgi:glycosyltransferase involved in cell wall biosynthesis
MPGVVIEAGLSGVASVATDVGGTSELVDETTGALVSVDHDDPAAAFADGVRAVVTDAARRGAAARERCLAGFTTDRIVHQWSELILEVAAEGRRSRPARPASRRAAPGQASLHLCASSDRRGAEVFALDLVDALRAAGDDAEVRALRPGPGGPHLDVEAIGSTRVDPRGLRRLRHLADGGGVVVAHGADTLQSTAVALLGTATPWVYRSIGDPAYWGGVRAADLRIGVPLRRATTVVTLWPGGADALMARYGLPASRIEVITNAVPAERFPRRDERSVAAARHALGLDERPVVAWVGSLAAEKHPELAVDVVASLAHVQLLVVGDGPLRAELQARADHVGGDRVRLIGQVDRTSDALLAADCLLLTSRTEGVPAVAIEAGLTGLPVVSTDVGGVHRVVEDGVTGRLVGDRDPATFSSAIRWALEHRDELGGAGHERCHRDFTMPRVAADWRDLLARVGRT